MRNLLFELHYMRAYVGPYVLANGGCFILDLALIGTLTYLTNWNDMYIVTGTFLVTSFCLYLVSRFVVFRETHRTALASFVIFWCVVAVKMLAALYMIHAAIEWLGISAVLARLFSGIIEAGVAFVFDYFATFRMQEVHNSDSPTEGAVY